LLAIAPGGHDLALPATMKQTRYQGWSGAIELLNGDARVVIVPAVGRIMHYGFAGGSNLLWENGALLGRTLPQGEMLRERGEAVWANFGGDRIWPTEERFFPLLNGRVRPPDHWIDGQPWEAKLGAEGVTITSPVSRYCGARVVRNIRLAPQGTRLEIRERVEKVRLAERREHEPVPLTLWSLTQIHPPDEALISLSEASVFPGRYLAYRWPDVPDNDPAGHFFIEGAHGVFSVDPQHPQKIGADAPRWVAAVCGRTVIAEVFRHEAGRVYPEGGTSATIFTSPELAELECLSPLERLAVGGTLDHAVAWELLALPGEPLDGSARRRLVVEWLDGLEVPLLG
jgi:hypothetical protein